MINEIKGRLIFVTILFIYFYYRRYANLSFIKKFIKAIK